MVQKIVSGGQTGVDLAALQVAIDVGLAHGGWCPPGRQNEAGLIPLHYELKETPEERDEFESIVPRSQRTIWNIRDSDGLLVITSNTTDNDVGTLLTIKTAISLNRPIFSVILEDPPLDDLHYEWIDKNRIRTVNVCGPSESTLPGAYKATYNYLYNFFFVL